MWACSGRLQMEVAAEPDLHEPDMEQANDDISRHQQVHVWLTLIVYFLILFETFLVHIHCILDLMFDVRTRAISIKLTVNFVAQLQRMLGRKLMRKTSHLKTP